MNVIIREADPSYTIRDTKVSITEGQHRVKWSYKQADGFIIVAYPHFFKDFNAAEYAAERFRQMENEKSKKEQENGIILLSVLSANVPNGGVSLGAKSKSTVPMIVRVYAYDKVDEGLILYAQNNEGNVSDLQYTIKYATKYTPGFLFFRKPKEAVTINNFEGFFAGLLYYTVSGRKAKYPITESMINRGFVVSVVGRGQIAVKVSEQYRNFFRCSGN